MTHADNIRDSAIEALKNNQSLVNQAKRQSKDYYRILKLSADEVFQLIKIGNIATFEIEGKSFKLSGVYEVMIGTLVQVECLNDGAINFQCVHNGSRIRGVKTEWHEKIIEYLQSE